MRGVGAQSQIHISIKECILKNALNLGGPGWTTPTTPRAPIIQQNYSLRNLGRNGCGEGGNPG